MWELDHKEGWVLKNWYFWIVMLEKTLETPLESKEIKPVNSEGNQPWIFTGRTDAEAQTPIPWPPDAKSQFTGKDPDARKDWRQKKRVRWLYSIKTQWTWIWANSGRCWRTGNPGVLQSMGSQRVGHNLATEQWYKRKAFLLSCIYLERNWKSLTRVWLFATPWTDYVVHGILWARILGWVAFPFSRGSSRLRDQTQVSHIAGGFITS